MSWISRYEGKSARKGIDNNSSMNFKHKFPFFTMQCKCKYSYLTFGQIHLRLGLTDIGISISFTITLGFIWSNFVSKQKFNEVTCLLYHIMFVFLCLDSHIFLLYSRFPSNIKLYIYFQCCLPVTLHILSSYETMIGNMFSHYTEVLVINDVYRPRISIHFMQQLELVIGYSLY